MAKAIKSPTSARPSALPSPVAGSEKFSDEEKAFIESAGKFTPEEQSLIDSASQFSPEQPQQRGFGIRPGTQEYLQQMGLMTPEGAPATPFGGLSKDLQAEMVGGVASTVPPALIGARIGAPYAPPFGAAAGYLAGSMIGAGFTKDAVNKIRSVMDLPEQQDRSRGLDVLITAITSIPGLGAVVNNEAKILAKEMSQGVQEKWAKSLMEMTNPRAKVLGEDAIGALQTLKLGIFDAMKGQIGAEEAAKQIANLEDDFVKELGRGMSEKQAAAAVAEKYSFQLQAHKAKDNLLNSIGEEISSEELAKQGIVTRPQDIIEKKRSRLIGQWGTIFEAIKQTKGLDLIDSETYIPKLMAAKSEAESIGDSALVRQLNNVIEGLGNRKKLKEVAVFAEKTGGKTPKYYDMNTGRELSVPGPEGNVPFPETQEAFVKSKQEPIFETIVTPSLPGRGQSATRPNPPIPGVMQSKDQGPFIFETQKINRPEVTIGEREATYPASEQLGFPLRGPQVPLTAEQKAANLLPPQLANANESSVMQSIDSIIQRRVLLDRSIQKMEEGPRREAMVRAVQVLRGIEDDFMKGLQKRGGQYADLADRYIATKANLSILNESAENMARMIDQDAIGVSKILDTMNNKQIQAWSSLMPTRVRGKVARKYFEGLIDMSAGMPDQPYTKEQFKKIQTALTGGERNVQQSKLASLIGEKNASEAYQELGNLQNLVNRASMLPEGSLPERQMARRIAMTLEKIVMKTGGNFVSAGRMALDPNKRAYRDFLNFMMSKHFDQLVVNIGGKRELAETAGELARVFGQSSPQVAKFYQMVKDQGLLPSAVAAQVPAFVGATTKALITPGMPGEQ